MKSRITHPELSQPSSFVSSAVACDGWLTISGQGPLSMATKAVVSGTIEEETLLTLKNLEQILLAAGCSRNDVVRCTCYIADLADFAGFNTTYADFFKAEVPPARTTVQTGLLNGIKVEIDAIARCTINKE